MASLARWNELTDGPIMRLGPGVNYFQTSALAPLIVQQDEDFFVSATRRYYFWFFGYVAKFPYEREIKIEYSPMANDFDFEVDDVVHKTD